MPALLDLLQIYPIVETLAAFLPFGSLLELSRTDSSYRATLHGFPSSYGLVRTSDTNICNNLNIGHHETRLWRRLKSLTLKECSETGHTKGMSPKGCLMCSLPVCQACIVKNSFGKKEHTFPSRRRNLCQKCWDTGNIHAERLRCGPSCPKVVDYGEIELCRCTAKDGILCCDCKEQQRSDLQQKLSHCAGYGCGTSVPHSDMSRRICLWCTLVLPSPHIRGTSTSIHQQAERALSYYTVPEGSLSHQVALPAYRTGMGTPLEDQRVPLYRRASLPTYDQ